MKEDLKNVIISFGLIAVVLTNGSFAYQLATKQEELQNAKTEMKLALEEQSSLIEKTRQEELKKQQAAARQLTAQQSAAQRASTPKATNPIRQQAQVAAPTSAPAVVTPVVVAPVVTAPSRRSRAS